MMKTYRGMPMVLLVAFTICQTCIAGWSELDPDTGGHIFAVCFPENDQTGFIGCFFEHGIYRTTDGGLTWTDVTPTHEWAIWSFSFPSGGQTGYAAGGTGATQQPIVLKTTDGGLTWENTNVSGYTGTFYDVECGADTDHVWAVGDMGVMASDDGGSTWNRQWTNGDPVGGADFIDNQTGYAVGGYGTGLIIKTTDGGSTWTEYEPGSNFMTDILFPAGPDTGYAIADGKIWKSVDAGDTWVRIDRDLFGVLNGLCFPTGTQTGYIVGGNGKVYKTFDGGMNWETQSTPTSSELVDVDFPQDAITGYIGGVGNTLLKTEDGGGSTAISEQPIVLIHSNEFGIGAEPSPFWDNTMVRFRIPTDGPTAVNVYNVCGLKVCTLEEGNLHAGTHQLTWTGTDDAGRILPSGAYVLRLEHSAGTVSRNVVLIR
ncbi:MAG: hypothetical protein GF388_00080 [Candidatus Aegiribacteria sp.]|nr:hypothetical protein [Candidatus Aegiribacteria sp.]